ncbi:MAG: hypothetical protein V7K18_01470 [Nostoc sp.]
MRFASRAHWSQKTPQPSSSDGRTNRLHRIWTDGGDRGEDFMRWVMDV